MSPAVVMKVLAETENPDAMGLSAGPASGLQVPANPNTAEAKHEVLGAIPDLTEDEAS